MRHLRVFNILIGLALIPAASFAQPWLTQEGDQWVRTYQQTAPPHARLRIVSHGPVLLEGGVTQKFEFTVKVSVHARNREQARAILERMAPTVETQNGWLVLTTPGRSAVTRLDMRAPRLQEVIVSNSDGVVEAYGIDGPVTIDTGADDIKVDRIHGNCALTTGGGEIHAGTVDGFLHCTTGAGRITAQSVGTDGEFNTNGGDIRVMKVNGPARAQTGGGTVQLGFINGPVTAVNNGGPIFVDVAAGIVTTRNMAGPVRVLEAGGIHCDSLNGGIVLGRIRGPMRVSTSVGSITANLQGSKLSDSYLATGNGDITVLIPSNVGVTVSAENQMADSIRRIISEFTEIRPAVRGVHLEAYGKINGGGPPLQLSASSGTIFLKRTQ